MKQLLLLLTFVTVLFGCKEKEPEKKDLYKEPIMTFGASRATIKQQEKRNYIDAAGSALLYAEDNYWVMYTFEEDTLANSAIILPLKTNMDDIIDFISSKYEYLGKDETNFYWTSTDQKIGIVVFAEKLGIYVIYLPLQEEVKSTAKASDNMSRQIKFIKEKLINL